MATQQTSDTALMQAWGLSVEDYTDAVIDELEPLIPVLVDATYAEADDYTWRFSPTGVARAEDAGSKEAS